MHNWGDSIPGCENSPAKALRGEIGCVWARASNNEWVEDPGLKRQLRQEREAIPKCSALGGRLGCLDLILEGRCLAQAPEILVTSLEGAKGPEVSSSLGVSSYP